MVSGPTTPGERRPAAAKSSGGTGSAPKQGGLSKQTQTQSRQQQQQQHKGAGERSSPGRSGKRKSPAPQQAEPTGSKRVKIGSGGGVEATVEEQSEYAFCFGDQTIWLH